MYQIYHHAGRPTDSYNESYSYMRKIKMATIYRKQTNKLPPRQKKVIYRSDSGHTCSQVPLHSAAELAALSALKQKGATVCLAASLSHRRRPDDGGGSNDPSLSVG